MHNNKISTTIPLKMIMISPQNYRLIVLWNAHFKSERMIVWGITIMIWIKSHLSLSFLWNDPQAHYIIIIHPSQWLIPSNTIHKFNKNGAVENIYAWNDKLLTIMHLFNMAIFLYIRISNGLHQCLTNPLWLSGRFIRCNHNIILYIQLHITLITPWYSP